MRHLTYWGMRSYKLYTVHFFVVIRSFTSYSNTLIYHGVWGQGNIRGISGSAVNQGFVWFTLCLFSPFWGKGNGRGISGFAVNRGAVNRGAVNRGAVNRAFTVVKKHTKILKTFISS